MSTHTYSPRRVCARQISFDLENGTLHNVRFLGGCPGNLAAIAKLLEGADAAGAVRLLKGNDCGGRGTSCADQLALAIEAAMEKDAAR